MGYCIAKYLDSAEYGRALYFLDSGEADLPIPDKSVVGIGSRAISQATGQEWFLNSKYEWTPVKKDFSKTGITTLSDISPRVNQILVTPKKLSVAPNTDIQFKVDISGENILDDSVFWSISSGKSSEVSINQKGLLHIGNVADGKIVVKANMVSDSSLFGEATVIVDSDMTADSKITGIQILPKSASLKPGDKLQFKTETSFYSSVNEVELQNIEWTVDQATNSTISNSGLLVVGIGETSKVIIVSAKETLSGVEAMIPVFIAGSDEKLSITGVHISPDKELTVGENCEVQCVASVIGEGNYSKSVSWFIDSVTDLDSIDNNGLLTIGKANQERTITISAKSDYNLKESNEITISVDPSKKEKPQVIQLVASPKTMVGYKSCSYALSVQKVNINNKYSPLSWSIIGNNSNFTKVNNGILTISSEESASAILIKAALADNDDIYDVITVAVSDIPTQGGGDTPVVTSGIKDVNVTNSVLEFVYPDDTTKKVKVCSVVDDCLNLGFQQI